MVRVLIATLLLGLVLGCEKGDGLDRASVDGKVTLDGTPVEKGAIAFIPTGDTKGPAVGGEILKGEYSIPSAEGPVMGRHRVEIRASRKTGEMVQAPMAAEGEMVEKIVEGVPKQYNSESTLEKEIKAGKNVHDFELTYQAVEEQ